LAQESFPGHDIKDLGGSWHAHSGKIEEVTCVVGGELKALYPAFPIGDSEEDRFSRRLELYNRMNILFIRKYEFDEGKVDICAFEFWEGRTVCRRHSKPCADCALQFKEADVYFIDIAHRTGDYWNSDKLCKACLQKRLKEDELFEFSKDDAEVVRLLRTHREMFGTISSDRVESVTNDPRDVRRMMRSVMRISERDAYFRKEKLFRQSAGLEALFSLSEPSV
jgi:hypothetical protein